MTLPSELRELIEAGPLTHLSTINADGSPQVTVTLVGLDGDEIVSGHMGIVRYAIERISGVGPWVPKSSDRRSGTPT